MSSISLTTTTTTNSTTSSTRKYMDHMEPLKDMSWSLLLSSMKRKPVEPNFQEDEAFAWSEACSSNSHSLPSKYFSFMTTTTTHLSIHDLNTRDHESSSKALNLSNEDDDLYWFPEISWQTLEQVRCGCSSCRYHQATTCGNSCQDENHHRLGSDWKPLTRISSLSTSTNIQQELDLTRSDQVREEEEGCTSFWNPILPHVPASYAVNENTLMFTNFGKHVAEVDSLEVSIPSATQQQETTPSPDQSQILHNETSSLLENPLIGSKENDEEPSLGILSSPSSTLVDANSSTIINSQRRELFPWLSRCKQTKIQKPKKMLRPLEIPKKSIQLVRK